MKNFTFILLLLFLVSCKNLLETKSEVKVANFMVHYRQGYNDAMQGMKDFLDNVTQNKHAVAMRIRDRHRQAAFEYAIKEGIMNEKISNYIVESINW